MNHSNRVTEDSQIDPQELQELIERLSDPGFAVPNGHVTVKDLAETLEVSPERVAIGLQQLREENELQFVPQVASRHRPESRSRFVVAFILAALSLSIAIFCFVKLTSPPPNLEQPVRIQPSPDRSSELPVKDHA